MLAESGGGVDTIFQLLLHELTAFTKASRRSCEQHPERNTWQQWQSFQIELTPQQVQLLHLKQQHLPELAIAQKLGCTMPPLQKQWSKLLEQAWEIRNHLASGFSVSTYE